MTTPHDEFENGLGDRLRELGDTLEVDPSLLDEAEQRSVRAVRRTQATRVGLVAAGLLAVVGVGVGVLQPWTDSPSLEPIAPVEDAADLDEDVEDEARRAAEEAARLEDERILDEDVVPTPEATMPGAGSWQSIPAGPIASPTHAAWTGEVLLVGGWCGEVGCPGQLAAFDPATDGWTEFTRPPFEWRYADTEAIWTGDELLVVGGLPTTEGDPDFPVVPTVAGFAYDPSSESWREIPEAPLAPREGLSATWTGTEVIVFGGYALDRGQLGSEEDTPITMFSDGAAWDPATNEWRTIAASPLEPRAEHAAHWTGDRLLVAAGGTSTQSYPEFTWPDRPTTAAFYDPATDAWSDVIDLGVGGPPAASAWTGAELILWNGATENWPAYGEDGPLDTYGVVWNPATGGLDPLAVPPVSVEREGRAPHTWAAELGALVTWGGGCGEGCNANHGDGAFYSPEAGWSRLAGSPMGPRRGPLTAWTGTELLVVGGYQYDVLDDTVPSGMQPDGARWRP